MKIWNALNWVITGVVRLELGQPKLVHELFNWTRQRWLVNVEMAVEKVREGRVAVQVRVACGQWRG